jgi:hypothetical protein
MDVSNPGFWIAIGVGGTVIASMSFAEQAMSKNKDEPFRLRAVFRDFCIGAFLTATIYMFLPESIQSWINMGKSAISSMAGGGEATGAASTTSTSLPFTSSGSGSASSDIELQFGPARF